MPGFVWGVGGSFRLGGLQWAQITPAEAEGVGWGIGFGKIFGFGSFEWAPTAPAWLEKGGGFEVWGFRVEMGTDRTSMADLPTCMQAVIGVVQPCQMGSLPRRSDSNDSNDSNAASPPAPCNPQTLPAPPRPGKGPPR